MKKRLGYDVQGKPVMEPAWSATVALVWIAIGIWCLLVIAAGITALL